jgi:protein gp37
MSKIEWTEETWNPLIGCSKVSPGCKNCYAIQTAWIRQHNPKMAERYAGVVEKTTAGALNWTGKVNVAKEAIDKPLRRKKPTMYFVNSMSDLFHEAVPFSVIHDIFNTMAACPQHTFQILTKRPARMLEYVRWFQRAGRYAFDFGPNVWIGVSVENQQAANERIPLLLQVPAAVRFLSCEPLLGPVDLKNIQGPVNRYQVLEPITRCGDSNRPRIDWVIVGGESGKDARPMHRMWAQSLRDQCQKAGVSYFFKQWGAWVPCGQEPDFIAGNEVRSVRNILPDGSVYTTGVIRAGDLACMKLVGKKKAGRMLDGREWNEFPGQPVVAGDDPDFYTGGFD